MNKYIYLIFFKFLLIFVFGGCKPHKDIRTLNEDRLAVNPNSSTTLHEKILVTRSNSASTRTKEEDSNTLSSIPEVIEQIESLSIFSVQTKENLLSVAIKTEEENYNFTLDSAYTLHDGKPIDRSSIVRIMLLYIPIREAKSDDVSDMLTDLEFNKISTNSYSSYVYYPLNNDSHDHIALDLDSTIELDFSSKLNVERFEARKHDQMPIKKSVIGWKHWYKNDAEFSYISSFNATYTPKEGEEIHLLFYLLCTIRDSSEPNKYYYVRIPMNQDRINLVRGIYYDADRKDTTYKYSY